MRTILRVLLLMILPNLAFAESEVDSLVRQVETGKPSPPAEERDLGTLKYPVSGAAKMLPDISLIGSFAGAYFSTDPAGDQGHDPGATGFNLQEIELALQSNIDPYLRADVFLGFHEAGVELEEGFATTLGLVKGLQIRAGKFLIPIGRQNAKHLEQWHFVDTTLVNKYFLGAEGLSEIGVEAAYVFPLPFYLQAQASFSNGDNTASFGGGRKEDFLYQGRLVTSFDLSGATTLLIGGSGATGFNDSGVGNKTNLFGGDILLKYKPGARTSLTWQSEGMYRQRQTPVTNTKDGGFYSFVDLQFLKRWHVGARFDMVGLPDDSIVREWRLTPALTFDPTEFSRLRLQYEYDKADNADAVHAAFLQLVFNMGPHGAHAF